MSTGSYWVPSLPARVPGRGRAQVEKDIGRDHGKRRNSEPSGAKTYLRKFRSDHLVGELLTATALVDDGSWLGKFIAAGD